MNFGKGFKPDPDGHMVTPIALHPVLRLSAAPLPTATNNRGSGLVPNVMDQDGTGACTMHAVACATAHDLGFVSSQADGYALARMIAIADAGQSPDTPITDDGAAPNELERALRLFGARPTRAPAADGRNSDVDPSTINSKPTLGDLEADASTLLVGQYTIDPSQTDQMKQALAAGKLITCAIYADNGGPRSVEEWDPATGPLSAPATPIALNHYVVICDFRTATNGQTVWVFRNSWGTGWGISGDGEGDESWLAATGFCYVWDVRKAVA